jgi:hypothetical protein
VPNFQGRFQNITTKNGLINYEFKIKFKEYEYSRFAISSSIYRLEGIKNLNLLNLTELKNYDAKIYGKNNDSIQFDFIFEDNDLHNDLICKILYKTKYIDKMIYTYGIFNNKKYKYFGGTPENIIKAKNLKKFTFSKKEYVSKIIIRSLEDSLNKIYEKEIIDNLSGEGRSIEINNYINNMICIPDRHTNILKIFKRGMYESSFHRDIYYKLDKRQEKNFESISFMIGNKNITLNRNNLLLYSQKTDTNYLEIYDNCQNITFGRKFIKLFEFSEFNMETNEVGLFTSQKNKTITETEIKNEIKKKY